MPDDPEKLGKDGGPRSGGMVPQQAHANNYYKLVEDRQTALEKKDAAYAKLAKDLAPKEKGGEQQPQKDRGRGFEP
jgi:hypothetical protein